MLLAGWRMAYALRPRLQQVWIVLLLTVVWRYYWCCCQHVRGPSHAFTAAAAAAAQVGQLVARPEWYNAGYIFPAGFRSRLLFRSSVDLGALTLHECEIIGEGGTFWPAPTFVVTARDRQDEPVVAKSCTGCWSGVRR